MTLARKVISSDSNALISCIDAFKLHEASLSERQTLMKLIAAQDQSKLINHTSAEWRKLSLMGIDLSRQKRLDLFKEIMIQLVDGQSQQPFWWPQFFPEFINDEHSEALMNLAATRIRQGSEAIKRFCRQLKNLGSHRLPTVCKINLIKEIIEQSDCLAINTLLINFYAFCFHKGLPEERQSSLAERLNLVAMIAKIEGITPLQINISKLLFIGMEAPLHERLAIFEMILIKKRSRDFGFELLEICKDDSESFPIFIDLTSFEEVLSFMKLEMQYKDFSFSSGIGRGLSGVGYKSRWSKFGSLWRRAILDKEVFYGTECVRRHLGMDFNILHKLVLQELVNKDVSLNEKALVVSNFLKEEENLAPFAPIFNAHITSLLSKEEEKRVFVEYQLWQTCVYMALVLYELEDDRLEALAKHPEWLTAILDYRSPSHRNAFMRELSFLPASIIDRGPPHEAVISVRLWILLSRLEIKGVLSTEVKEQIYRVVRRDDFFKDSTRQLVLYDALFLFCDLASFITEEEKALINRGMATLFNFERRQKDVQKERLADLKYLYQIKFIFGKETLFCALREALNYKKSFTDRFSSLFAGVDKLSDVINKYERTFARFRDPHALFTYLSRLKQLPDGEREPVLKGLSDYVCSVLEETFDDLRNSTEGNPHLRALYAIPHTEEGWRAVLPSRILSIEDSSEGVSLKQKRREFFSQKIITDGHLQPLDHYALLVDFLRTGSSRDYQGELLAIENDPGIDRNTVNAIKLQRLLIDYCQEKITLEEFIASKPHMDLSELENDIRALQSDSKELKSCKYVASLTVDPCDLLLIGTEIMGSCQRVDGDANKNKCLLGYLLNGDVQAVVIKDVDGKIVARAILRLMLDDSAATHKPILLLERLYNNIHHLLLNQALIDLARQKAESMGIKLVSREVGGGTSCLSKIKYLGGRAPFNYSDASGGVLSGPFETEIFNFL